MIDHKKILENLKENWGSVMKDPEEDFSLTDLIKQYESDPEYQIKHPKLLTVNIQEKKFVYV